MSLEEKVIEALNNIRPQLQADGGDLEFVKMDESNNVHVRLTGACGGCPHATITIKDGIERILKDEIDPEIVVERV